MYVCMIPNTRKYIIKCLGLIVAQSRGMNMIVNLGSNCGVGELHANE